MTPEGTNDCFADDRGADPVTAAVTITTVQRDGLAVVTVTRSVDVLTTPQLSEAANQALTGHPRGLTIDLSTTDFLASSGMTALRAAHDAAPPTAVFAVVAVGPSTARPLQLVGSGLNDQSTSMAFPHLYRPDTQGCGGAVGVVVPCPASSSHPESIDPVQSWHVQPPDRRAFSPALLP